MGRDGHESINQDAGGNNGELKRKAQGATPVGINPLVIRKGGGENGLALERNSI